MKTSIATCSAVLALLVSGCGSSAPQTFEPRIGAAQLPATLQWVRFGETTEADVRAHYPGPKIQYAFSAGADQVPHDSINRLDQLPMAKLLTEGGIGFYLATVPDRPTPALVRLDLSPSDHRACALMDTLAQDARTAHCPPEVSAIHSQGGAPNNRCLGSADGRFLLTMDCSGGFTGGWLTYEIAVRRPPVAAR